ncbi:Hypothetical protein EAG7_03051 [Klebsiella aerogenes]|nr:Hypothetical protein EAG7_03051 [Klebsiella aerogenes]CCG31568.1 hypothetical protein [Klebsiella aerogenes EA1509E]
MLKTIHAAYYWADRLVNGCFAVLSSCFYLLLRFFATSFISSIKNIPNELGL